MTISRHILPFLLSKMVKLVYGTIKDHEKCIVICLILGKNGDSPIILKIITLLPTSNMKKFGEFVPKNPQKFSFPSPQNFFDKTRNPLPVLTLSPNFGDGEGDF